MERILYGFLLAEAGMSVLCFVLFALDKWFARRHTRRIRERTLLLSMLFLGAPGGLLSMSLFRHKTQHPSFWLTGVFSLLLHLLLACGIAYLSFR